MMDRETQRQHGGRRSDAKIDNIQLDPPPTGTSRDASIRRLRKDRPDLHQQVSNVTSGISPTESRCSVSKRKREQQPTLADEQVVMTDPPVAVDDPPEPVEEQPPAVEEPVAESPPEEPPPPEPEPLPEVPSLEIGWRWMDANLPVRSSFAPSPRASLELFAALSVQRPDLVLLELASQFKRELVASEVGKLIAPLRPLVTKIHEAEQVVEHAKSQLDLHLGRIADLQAKRKDLDTEEWPPGRAEELMALDKDLAVLEYSTPKFRQKVAGAERGVVDAKKVLGEAVDPVAHEAGQAVASTVRRAYYAAQENLLQAIRDHLTRFMVAEIAWQSLMRHHGSSAETDAKNHALVRLLHDEEQEGEAQ